ncbi:hypothetical protein, partial [Serratia marcescens]|uniref:hypothetical protein n=1 Tax=Serratia marcescens TaxID=615 RepID=UPI001955295D
NRGVNVGRAGIGADLSGHLDSPGIGAACNVTFISAGKPAGNAKTKLDISIAAPDSSTKGM